MAYDFNKLLADTEQYLSKHRVPEEHREMYGAQLYLASLSFAVALLGKEDVTEEDMPRVRHLAAELERAANFYYKLWLEQIRRHKRGRPQHMADIGFIYAMSHTWKGLYGWPSWPHEFHNLITLLQSLVPR